MSDDNPVSDLELLGNQESPLYTAKYDYRAQGTIELSVKRVKLMLITFR